MVFLLEWILQRFLKIKKRGKNIKNVKKRDLNKKM